jgi:DNA-binding NarL/FixJ family response regulator
VPVPLTVVIADDHPLFRQGLRALLDAQADIEVVAESCTGAEAVEAATTYRPCVIVMDLNMPVLSGIDATRQVVALSPSSAVLVLTMFDEDETVFAAMRAGARGYVLKDADDCDVLAAVRGVARGEAIFGPGVARKVLAYFSMATPPAQAAFPQLTERERDVLELIARGYGNVEIANRLFLSLKTVRNHVSNVFTKLQVADRAQAIVRAREAGLGLKNNPER